MWSPFGHIVQLFLVSYRPVWQHDSRVDVVDTFVSYVAQVCPLAGREESSLIRYRKTSQQSRLHNSGKRTFQILLSSG